MVGTDAVIDRFLLSHSQTECCDLTTTGWRSGRPHVVELWFGVHDGRVVMVSGNGPAAHWFRNAQADPAVGVRLAGHDLHGVARVVTDPAERRAIGEVMAAKYDWDGDPSIGLTREAWCFDVPALSIGDWHD